MDSKTECAYCDGRGHKKFISHQTEEYSETDSDECVKCDGTGLNNSEDSNDHNA